LLFTSTTFSSSNQECERLKTPSSPALVVDARNQEKGQELDALFREISVFSESTLKKKSSSDDLFDLLPTTKC
jgi:hypothetical protein